MAITASQVSELRKKTDCGMMDCKKALVDSNGDIEKAVEWLRKKGISKAAKRSDIVAAEGIILTQCRSDFKSAVMVEVNCETDFVARDDNFKQFAEHLVQLAQTNNIDSLESLLHTEFKAGVSVDEARQALIAKMGENIHIRRIAAIQTTGLVGCYMHGGRIGVLIAIEGGEQALAKDLAMHIAASKPAVVLPEQVDSAMLEKEREICMAQALASGKPENLIKKMVEGRIKKFVNEVSLTGQPFVKDSSMSVGELLKQKHAVVESFVRFELGEGIEKKRENFAEEVRAQLK